MSSIRDKRGILFIDGASYGNPGDAGIGVLVYDINHRCVEKVSQYIGKATNNVAEYTALTTALIEALILGFREIEVKSDSELLVRQLRGRYKVKSNNIKILYLLARHLIRGYKKVEIDYIRREQNKQADRLANEAINNRDR